MGDTLVELRVQLVVGVEQIKLHTSDIHTPDVGMHIIVEVRHIDHQRITVLVELTLHGQATEVLGFVVGHLLSVHCQTLGEVAVAIQETDGTHIDVGVGSLLHVVTGQHTQTTGIDLQGRVDTILHAEVGH